MSVRHALLALLSEGPKYGLQLREEFEARTGEVWPLNVGQVYQTLQRLAPDRVLVVGWATDFCVDSTVRSAVSHDYHVVVVGDAHTPSDRPHLAAPDVIRHHNWLWSGLLTNRSIRVATTAELTAEPP